MNTIIKVMESLVKLNNWTVERFDLHHYDAGDGFTGYVGYLTIVGNHADIRIREDGSFEFCDK